MHTFITIIICSLFYGEIFPTLYIPDGPLFYLAMAAELLLVLVCKFQYFPQLAGHANLNIGPICLSQAYFHQHYVDINK